jgi:CspA family cold shock protein
LKYGQSEKEVTFCINTNKENKMKGTIIRKREEGYGFIKPEQGDKDVFFHASALELVAFDDLQEGDVVSFDIEEGPKGPAAVNVDRAAATPATDDAASDDAADTDEAPAEEAAA